MTLRPWLSPAAKKQVVERDVWWQTHRPAAPNAFWDELMAALDMLCSFPDSGVLVRGRDVIAGMRRVPLSVSRAHVYFLRDDEAGLLRVYAVAGAIRGKRPPLPKKKTATRKSSPRRRR